ncbi:MAG: amino acid racemase [Hyphomicrobiales bacterium]|nr:amino acid racemase [Hyphomicrobiales bacterium]
MTKPHPILGIIGGMGPEATVELMARIVKATPAGDDADHLHMIVDNNPKIPSRIAALIDGTGESPAPELVRMARGLQAAGATFLAMPCNTAHSYAQDISAAVSIPLLNMVDRTADRIAHRYRHVGLLASTAVVRLRLYHRALGDRGMVVLESHVQDEVMEIIKAVKRGKLDEKVRHSFSGAAHALALRGADVLLVACTELSLLADAIDMPVPTVDSLDILRDSVVEYAQANAS